MATIQALLEQVKERVSQTTPAEVAVALAGDRPPALIDVRDSDELEDGLLPGAMHVPRGSLELKIEDAISDRARPMVIYCRSGTRSLLAAEALMRMGYQRVASMSGGFCRWRQEGRAVARPALVGLANRRRYKRHLLLPEVGEQGQAALLQAKVLLVGAGGIGSAVAYYLAAAGVGRLTVVDDDRVDETNLQRQILHTSDRLGMRKTDSAKCTLQALNPTITIDTVDARLAKDNAAKILDGHDIVVDGSDNFATRYLVNDTCLDLGIPNVHGSVHRFEGLVTVFVPEGPCYRCLHPERASAEVAPSCADAGVLGVLPGVVGLLAAVETIKLILGLGEGLVGRLLYYDALQAEFSPLKLNRVSSCPHCGIARRQARSRVA